MLADVWAVGGNASLSSKEERKELVVLVGAVDCGQATMLLLRLGGVARASYTESPERTTHGADPGDEEKEIPSSAALSTALSTGGFGVGFGVEFGLALMVFDPVRPI